MPYVCGYVICEDIYTHQFFGWFVSSHESQEAQKPHRAAGIQHFRNSEVKIHDPIKGTKADTEHKKNNKKLKHFIVCFVCLKMKIYIYKIF